MWLPLSVTKPLRHTGRPPRAPSSRPTRARAMGMTSMGRGKRPSVATIFESSRMHTKRCAAAARIFSRVRAPPPPLMSCRAGVASSAPSTYRAIPLCSFRSTISSPAARSRALVASELDIARRTLPGCAARASMKRFTVLPVPTPIVTSRRASSSAASAVRRFLASASVAIVVPTNLISSRNDCARIVSGHSSRESDSAATRVTAELRPISSSQLSSWPSSLPSPCWLSN